MFAFFKKLSCKRIHAVAVDLAPQVIVPLIQCSLPSRELFDDTVVKVFLDDCIESCLGMFLVSWS